MVFNGLFTTGDRLGKFDFIGIIRIFLLYSLNHSPFYIN